jgi:hypothetical protein
MHDIALSACAAIGWPLCLLLPEDRFEARFAIAPPTGFGLFAIGGTVFTVTMSLDKFAAQDRLTIELQTNAATRYPNDPRAFGLAIKELRLGK